MVSIHNFDFLSLLSSAPQQLNVTPTMLSEYQRKIAAKLEITNQIGGEKLCTTLYDKKRYVLHYR